MLVEKPEWEGTRKCTGVNQDYTRCSRFEIEGMDFCFTHVPDEFLDEAEDVTGLRRCVRMLLGDNSKRCRNAAEPGGLVCGKHGGQVRKQAGPNGPAVRYINQRSAEELSAIMSDGTGKWLLEPRKIGNPYEELLEVAGEIGALKDKLRLRISTMQDDQWRWQHSKVGEQISAWVLLYERALDRFATVLERIIKLGIEDRLASISERQITMIEDAVKKGMIEAGLGLEQQETARKAVGRHLRSA
jgi:hypothetical protein